MTKFKYALMVFSIFAASLGQADDGEKGDRFEKRRAAKIECAKSVGVELPEHGPKHEVMSALTDEQREKLRNCMQEKGFKPGKHRGKGKKCEDKE
jgi:hypothetical protein